MKELLRTSLVWQMGAHWIYIFASYFYSSNTKGFFNILATYLIFLILKGMIGLSKMGIFKQYSTLSFLVVINSTYLNLHYPQDKPWALWLACLVAIIFKLQARTLDQSRPILNPSIAAVLLFSLALPEYGTSSIRLWSANKYEFLIPLVFGIIVTYRARTILVSISYVLGHIIYSLVLARLLFPQSELGYNLATFNTALLGFGYLIFIFHVISDPQTSPKSRRSQLIFGLAIAIFDVSLKLLDYTFSPIIAYSAVSLAHCFYSEYYAYLRPIVPPSPPPSNSNVDLLAPAHPSSPMAKKS
jgi:hypothetical protein